MSTKLYTNEQMYFSYHIYRKMIYHNDMPISIVTQNKLNVWIEIYDFET